MPPILVGMAQLMRNCRSRILIAMKFTLMCLKNILSMAPVIVNLQGLFKNDFLGLTFKSFLGEDGKPIGPDLPGAVALEQMFGVDSSHGKWGDLSIVFAMIAVYRILFFVLIKLRENLGPRLRVTAWEYFSVHDREVEMKAVLRTGS